MLMMILLFLALFYVVIAAENPFERGCLYEKQKSKLLRVCNSEDDPALEGIKCRQPYFDHLEIRILSQNWESAFFETWILQIVLSELLNVPTTVETGTPNASLNFYDPSAPFDYGTADDLSALKTASQIIDCRLVANAVPYRSCAHIIPEHWTAVVKDAFDEGYIERPQSMGIVGQENWYMIRFAAERDSTLDSYIGLQGEENRRKLAETFKRPTTWLEYCTEVSTSNCTIPDDVAARAPLNATEEGRMFVDGLYTGHFRATEKNDCDTNPNCTGFVADYPCGWNSYLEAQTYHLDIALESQGNEVGSRGYTYEQLLDIWDAANATKSNLVSMWWKPGLQYSKYLGSDAEFHRVNFPPPTMECVQNRVSQEERCSLDKEERIGDPRGVCDEQATSLDKIIVSTLRDATRGPHLPVAAWSPAYNVLNSFAISEFQIYEIFEYFESEPTPRDALCRWASENMDYLETLVPKTYPRKIEEGDSMSVLYYITTALGSIAVLLVLVTIVLVHRNRKKPSIRYAQIAFLRLLLAGCLLIAIGAVTVGIPSTDATCVASIWLINLGYTLELVPLIVKIAAISAMMAAAQRMRRTKIRMRNLFVIVAVISGLMVVFLILWTVLDPPRRQGEYRLTETLDEDGTTIVDSSYYCRSGSNVWAYIAVGWDTLLLLCASVLAVQTRNLRQDFNESRTLAFLIYSHFCFVLFRLVTFSLTESGILGSTLAGMRSIIFSIDTISTICIYFVPKLATNATAGSSSFGNTTSNSILVPSATGTHVGPKRTTNSGCGSLDEVTGETMSSGPIDRPSTSANAFNEETSPVTLSNQTQGVPCRRCGFLEVPEDEKEHLLEEGKADGETSRDG